MDEVEKETFNFDVLHDDFIFTSDEKWQVIRLVYAS